MTSGPRVTPPLPRPSGLHRGSTALILLSGALFLTGCQHNRVNPEQDVNPYEARPPVSVTEPAVCPQEPVAQLSSELEDLMNYYAGLRTRTPAALKQDLEDAKKDFSTNGSESARVKLALLYTLPNAPFRNEALAAQLLESYQRGEGRGSGRLRGLAQVILAGLEMNRRGEAASLAMASRLRDEQKRTEELQRKLDALKDVERAMIQKDQGARKP